MTYPADNFHRTGSSGAANYAASEIQIQKLKGNYIMKANKYQLTEQTRVLETGQVLHRIKAVRNFGSVMKGQFGGWIGNEDNLSQDGNAWIGYDAMVYDDAEVFDDAVVSGKARVFGSACICGEAKVYENARVSGDASVIDHAEVHGTARVYEDAIVSGNALVFGSARIHGDAYIHSDMLVFNNSDISTRTKAVPSNLILVGSINAKPDPTAKRLAYNYGMHEAVERCNERLHNIDPRMDAGDSSTISACFDEILRSEGGADKGLNVILSYMEMLHDMDKLEGFR